MAHLVKKKRYLGCLWELETVTLPGGAPTTDFQHWRISFGMQKPRSSKTKVLRGITKEAIEAGCSVLSDARAKLSVDVQAVAHDAATRAAKSARGGQVAARGQTRCSASVKMVKQSTHLLLVLQNLIQSLDLLMNH